MEQTTIYEAVKLCWELHGDRPALTFKSSNSVEEYNHSELQTQVLQLRRAIWAQGLRPGDRAVILSENRPEWAIADLACQSLGIISVPIYPTLPQNQVEHIIWDSQANIVFASTSQQVSKVIDLLRMKMTLKAVVSLSPSKIADVVEWNDFINLSHQCSASDAELEVMASNVLPSDTATIIYTSGTTGSPKGAELSHTALLYTGLAAQKVVPLDYSDVFLSFLPLSHIIERVGGHYLPLTIGAHIVYSQGVTNLKKEIATVRPTVFLSVPRVFEYIQEAVMDQLPKQTKFRQRMFHIAMKIGQQNARICSLGRKPNPFIRLIHKFATDAVLSKIRNKVTGGRDRFFVSGGAPLSATTSTFFNALGVCLLEGYGLTECPVIALSRPMRSKSGTVGEVLPGMEVKIAEDGEILSRGPNRMTCYYNQTEATAIAIDADGWFHTGDIGAFDELNRLRIVDRKKDIIVLANGKNVAPQPIEALFKASTLLVEVVLIGDKQATISALIVPNWVELSKSLTDLQIEISNVSKWLDNSNIKKCIRQELDKYSAELADFERIKQFRLLESPFTIEGGELTPTLKVKRKVIQEKYANLIAEMAK